MPDFNDSFRYKRKAPETQFFTMEALLLGNIYDLVENIQRMKQSTSKDEIEKICDGIDQDIDNLREHLRNVRAETKLIRGGEPLPKQTELPSPQ